MLLDLMRRQEEIAAILTELNTSQDADEELPLIAGEDLPEVYGYMGGVANGLGLRKLSCHRASY